MDDFGADTTPAQAPDETRPHLPMRSGLPQPSAAWPPPSAAPPRPFAWTPTTFPTPAPRWRRVLVALVGPALVFGAIGVVVVIALANRGADTSHPEEWDPRVTEIATMVSTTRELAWEHPVYIDFLPEDEFVALFDAPFAVAPTAEDTELALAFGRVYDAMGLAVDYDPAAGEAAVSAVTTLGFYSLDNDRIYVRGDVLTPAVRVVIAHELTHALQAQHFELEVGGPNDLELRAIVEADAMRVEGVFRGTLSTQEQQAADSGNELGSAAADDLTDVPWTVLEQRYAPYVLGPLLVNDVYATAGNAGVDRLILNPPAEEVLLSPWLLGELQSTPPVRLAPPADTTELQPVQAASPLEMLVMLDAWLPWQQARSALDGWAGGLSATYLRDADDRVCFAAALAFDDSAQPFVDAIEDWATAAGSSVAPTVDGATVTFEVCERGDGAQAPAEPVIAPLLALQIESDAISIAGDEPTGQERDGYRCLAATLIDDPAAAPLLVLAELTSEQQVVFDAQAALATDACGVPPLNRQP